MWTRTASSPSPLNAIRSPSSVPGSIMNSILFFSFTTFWPLHFLHFSLSRSLTPSPLHSGHGDLTLPTSPGPSYMTRGGQEVSDFAIADKQKQRRTMRSVNTTPLPEHFEHSFGVTPGLAPLPLHPPHTRSRSMLITTFFPLNTSSRVISYGTVVSLPFDGFRRPPPRPPLGSKNPPPIPPPKSSNPPPNMAEKRSSMSMSEGTPPRGGPSTPYWSYVARYMEERLLVSDRRTKRKEKKRRDRRHWGSKAFRTLGRYVEMFHENWDHPDSAVGIRFCPICTWILC